MSQHPFTISITANPITHSLYSESWNEGLIAPGTPKLLLTENFLNIQTEDFNYIETE